MHPGFCKKETFFIRRGLFEIQGFQVADTAEPFFELLYLPFEGADEADSQPKDAMKRTEVGAKADIPRFKDCVKNPQIKENGYVLYYAHQCPFTAKYVPMLEQAAKEHKISFKSILINSKEDAQNMPVASTTYALFYNGKFVTNEILSDKKFLKMCGVEEL